MQDIKILVKRIIQKHGTNDPFEICRALKIKIKYSDLGSIRGIYQYKFKKRTIHLNCTLDYFSMRQVCAHELAHAILHSKVNTAILDAFTLLSTDKIEIEANAFAAELLISDLNLYEFEGCCMNEVAASLCVTETMVEYKVKNLSK